MTKEKGNDPLEMEKSLEVIADLVPERKAAISLWNVLSDEKLKDWSLEQYVSSGLIARQMSDFGRWVIGRLAISYEKYYGADELGKFAQEIGVEKGTIAVWRWVAEKFLEIAESDADLLIMPFSAYVVARNAPGNPMDWIIKAHDENWSIEKLKYEINVTGGKVDKKDELEPKPEILKCEICKGYRIINTNKLCSCDGTKTPEEQAKLDEGKK